MRGVSIRTVLLVVFVGILVAAIAWWRSRPQDIPLVDWPAVDSKGYIAALMEKDGVDRLVSISPSGEIREAGGGAEITDQDITWKPDGKRIAFVSNRSSDSSPQIFEWKPDRDSEPFGISPAGASRQATWFTLDGNDILFASRGEIYAIGYPSRHIRHVMPPSQERETGEEEGSHTETGTHEHDLIAQAWGRVSDAIESEGLQRGYITADKRYLAAVCATARGQAFVIQDLEATDDKSASAKVPLAGDAIQVVMHPKENSAIVSVVNFRYPSLAAVPKEMVGKDGKVKRDFVNAVFSADLTTGTLTPIFFSPDDSQSMDSPALSPDGTEVALVYRDKNGKPQELVVAPVSRGGVADARSIVQGEVSEPCWSPDGEWLAFVRGGSIWTVSRNGSQEKNVTEGKGKFRSPQFSPMR